MPMVNIKCMSFMSFRHLWNCMSTTVSPNFLRIWNPINVHPVNPECALFAAVFCNKHEPWTQSTKSSISSSISHTEILLQWKGSLEKTLSITWPAFHRISCFYYDDILIEFINKKKLWKSNRNRTYKVLKYENRKLKWILVIIT